MTTRRWTKVILLRVDESLFRKIREEAATRGLTVMGWIRMALTDYLDRRGEMER